MSETHINSFSSDIVNLNEDAVSNSGIDPMSYTMKLLSPDPQYSSAHPQTAIATTPMDEMLTETLTEQQIAALLSSATGMDFSGCSVSSSASSGAHSICSAASASSVIVPLSAQQVQSLIHELDHTKQLLRQYQARTEYLMDLVTKQTNKISDLRKHIATIEQNKQP